MKHLYCGLLLALTAAPFAATDSPSAPADLAELVKELKTKTDNAESDTVRELANLKTGEALDALFEVYEVMNSVYMRRAVLRGMALYDDVAGEERRALQKIMDAATGAQDRELRETAVDLLAGCANYGKAFLAMVVESAADDDVRELAMLHHSGSPRATDQEWYRKLYAPPGAASGRKSKKKGAAEPAKTSHTLPAIRVLAFEALASKLDLADVKKACTDRNAKIRIRALEELDARGDGDVLGIAEETYDRVDYPPADRLVCAKILMRHQGAKIAARFIKDGGKPATPEYLAFGLADLLAELNDEGVNKKLLKAAGKGKGQKRLFSLRAVRHLDDPKLDKVLLKLLRDKDDRIALEALAMLADRKKSDAIPELEKLVAKAKDNRKVSAALDAIYAIRGDDPEWIAELLQYAENADSDIRNGALEVIGKTRNVEFMAPLLKAVGHENWSTRLAAARGLESMRNKEGVGAIALRMEHETGRMSYELAEILWRLTGKPFRTNGRLWRQWWENEGDSFEFIAARDLRKLEKEEDERRLRQITKTSFFGIRIVSHRIIFIIDKSGSMAQPTRGRYVGERGPQRMTVAKRELTKSLEALDKRSLFNIVPFSDGEAQWRDRITERTTETLEEAKEYVKRMDASGGTNLYGALRLAFDDADVDTIFVLSDGEPTVGDVTDGNQIRTAVERWNRHRDVTIHCIAVGGSLQVLEWLAQDTGGSYVKYP